MKTRFNSWKTPAPLLSTKAAKVFTSIRFHQEKHTQNKFKVKKREEKKTLKKILKIKFEMNFRVF